jgi:hypothetical protein
MKAKNKLKLQVFLSKPRWQLRIISVGLAIYAGLATDIFLAYVAGLMLGWSFSFGDKK